LKVFTKASAVPLLSGLSTGVKHGTKLSASDLDGAVGGEDRAVVGQPPHRLREMFRQPKMPER
jgi:hypothetical protein